MLHLSNPCCYASSLAVHSHTHGGKEGDDGKEVGEKEVLEDVTCGGKEPGSRGAALDGVEGRTLETMPLLGGFEARQIGAALTAADFQDGTNAAEALSYASLGATPEQLLEDLARTSM